MTRRIRRIDVAAEAGAPFDNPPARIRARAEPGTRIVHQLIEEKS
jgi:hypothetical protein